MQQVKSCTAIKVGPESVLAMATIGGYFAVQDTIVIIQSIAMAFSMIRRNPDDPTRWIPVTRLSALRWIAGIAVVASCSLSVGRSATPADFIVSSAGTVIYLSGGVFFYGAKSPLSSILAESDDKGIIISPRGFYRISRNPLFFGLFLCSIGLPVYVLSLPGLLISLAVALPLLLHSSKVLDAYWQRRAGEAYSGYRDEVRLFVPSIKHKWKAISPPRRI